MFFFVVFITAPSVDKPNNLVQTSLKESLCKIHSINSPIDITSNTQLATWASSGDGTSGNPYIIENRIIICAYSFNETGISIQNTNKYFILKNITVSHCYTGFYFSHVIFGSISNSYAINDSYIDFYLEFSSYNSLTNNKAMNSIFDPSIIMDTTRGFILYSSSYNNLASNTAVNLSDAFLLDFSSFNSLTNNTAINSEYIGEIYPPMNYQQPGNITTNNIFIGGGFILSDSSDISLTSNTAINDGEGFVLTSSSKNTLENNIAINNTGGIALYSSSYNILENNKITNSTYTGLSLFNSSSNILTSNTVIKNNDGFYLTNSSTNILRNNIGSDNRQYDYVAVNSLGNSLIANRFNDVYSVSILAFNPKIFLGTLCIIVIVIVLLSGLLMFFPSKNNLKNNNRLHLNTDDESTKIDPSKDVAIAINLVETILTESYQAPDYETTLKIQQGRFPDYITFKQALDKGITTYTEWLRYNKKH